MSKSSKSLARIDLTVLMMLSPLFRVATTTITSGLLHLFMKENGMLLSIPNWLTFNIRIAILPAILVALTWTLCFSQRHKPVIQGGDEVSRTKSDQKSVGESHKAPQERYSIANKELAQ